MMSEALDFLNSESSYDTTLLAHDRAVVAATIGPKIIDYIKTINIQFL
jgi:hypothetical protein